MILQIFAAQSTSAAPHVHFRNVEYSAGSIKSASAGLSGERTFFFEPAGKEASHNVPIGVRDIRVYCRGVFTSVSGSANLRIETSPNSGTLFFPLHSASAAFVTTLQAHAGEVWRFNYPVGASATGGSVDLFIS